MASGSVAGIEEARLRQPPTGHCCHCRFGCFSGIHNYTSLCCLNIDERGGSPGRGAGAGTGAERDEAQGGQGDKADSVHRMFCRASLGGGSTGVMGRAFPCSM